jgi:hypothetical protein
MKRAEHDGRMMALEDARESHEGWWLRPRTVGDHEVELALPDEGVDVIEGRVVEFVGIVYQHDSSPPDGVRTQFTVPASHLDTGCAIVAVQLVEQGALSYPADAEDSYAESCARF